MTRRYALADKKTRVVKKIIEQHINAPPPHSDELEAIIVQDAWGISVGDRFGKPGEATLTKNYPIHRKLNPLVKPPKNSFGGYETRLDLSAWVLLGVVSIITALGLFAT